ncbi:hypothetical protein E3N88_18530 [Mikania micrantha]|uniref:Uncharacterized protein n=1 Tax=Mikania micrantha TaxID=192012 RepID=A0A5N6NL25_9ASTR|nr:hypothetical protein E3N88_18530 [Mikania micrantha]
MCNVNNLITSIITHDIVPRELSARRGNPILPRRLGGVETFSIGRVLGLVGCGAHENSTIKRAQVAAIQGWVTSLGSFHPEGVETFSIGRVLGLVGCGAHENSTVKRAQVVAIQGWVTSLGSFHPGNQK